MHFSEHSFELSRDTIARFLRRTTESSPINSVELIKSVELLFALSLSNSEWKNLIECVDTGVRLRPETWLNISESLTKLSPHDRNIILASYPFRSSLLSSLPVAVDGPGVFLSFLAITNFVRDVESTSSPKLTEQAKKFAIKVENEFGNDFNQRQAFYAQTLELLNEIDQEYLPSVKDYIASQLFAQALFLGNEAKEFFSHLNQVSKVFLVENEELEAEEFFRKLLVGPGPFETELFGYNLTRLKNGLKEFVEQLNTPEFSRHAQEISLAEDLPNTLLRVICLLDLKLPEELKDDAIIDFLLLDKNPGAVNNLQLIQIFTSDYLKSILVLGPNARTELHRINQFLDGNILSLVRFNSAYFLADSREHSIVGLMQAYPEFFKTDSPWISWIKGVLDYQDSICDDTLTFRQTLYAVLNTAFRKGDDTLLDSWEIYDLKLSSQSLSNFFRLQILLEETAPLRVDYKVTKTDFLENLLRALGDHQETNELTVIAKTLIMMGNDPLRTYLTKQLLILPDLASKQNLIKSFASGFLKKKLTDFVAKFLNSEDLSSYITPQFTAYQFGPLLILSMSSQFSNLPINASFAEIQSNHFTSFVLADRLPKATPEETALMQQQLSTAFQRMYQDYHGFGALTYDARGAKSVLSEFGRCVFQSADAINSLNVNSYPGHGYKFSYPKIENLFNLEKGDQPLRTYKETWPWLADCLQHFPTTEIYNLRAFKAFGNSNDPRLCIDGVDYVYLFSNEHYLNYAGELALLVPAQFLENELADTLIPLAIHKGPDPKVADSANSHLTLEKLIHLGKERGIPVFRIGCGSNLSGGFCNVFEKDFDDHDTWVDGSLLRIDLWGRGHKDNSSLSWLVEQREVERHQQIAKAVDAGQGYSDLFNIVLANFHKGQVVGNQNPYYMLDKAVYWNETLDKVGADKDVYPVLYLASSTNLARAPFNYFTLDSKDLILRDSEGRALAVYDEYLSSHFKAVWEELVLPALTSATDLRFYDRRTIKDLVPFNMDNPNA